MKALFSFNLILLIILSNFFVGCGGYSYEKAISELQADIVKTSISQRKEMLGELLTHLTRLKSNEDVNFVDSKGQTTLMWASAWGNTKLVKLLITNGANVNAKHTLSGWTALVIAVNLNHNDLAMLLLNNGADIGVRLHDNSLLHMAFKNDNFDLLQLLIEQGADVNSMDKERMTILRLAASKGRRDIVQHVIAKGADINAKNKEGWTALMVVSCLGKSDMVQYLIDNGADVNAKGDDGKTALMLAFNQDVKKILMEHGAK